MSYRLLTNSDTSTFLFDENGCTDKILKIYAGNQNNRTKEFINNANKQLPFTFDTSGGAIQNWYNTSIYKKNNTAYNISLTINPLGESTKNRSCKIYLHNNSKYSSSQFIQIDQVLNLKCTITNNVDPNIEYIILGSTDVDTTADKLNNEPISESLLNIIQLKKDNNDFYFQYNYQLLYNNTKIVLYYNSIKNTYETGSFPSVGTLRIFYKLNGTWYFARNISGIYSNFYEQNNTYDLVVDTYTPILLIDDTE